MLVCFKQHPAFQLDFFHLSPLVNDEYDGEL